MKTGYAIMVASGWPQCDTDENFGFAATVNDIYIDHNKAVEARDAMIKKDKEEIVANYKEDGDEDRVGFEEGEIDDEKYLRFYLDGYLQVENKYYIKPVYIRD